ncbi:hypothetical protein NPIL_142771 [Nephila pilipes]|uniref:Uncharacterized protein n=1 Tax=Nephila pilipes TaxID=299642 RepID=A0A8X6PRG6_NEPPI|nr:hypothetical protein NPIL_142771 [Nephila pilipes]
MNELSLPSLCEHSCVRGKLLVETTSLVLTDDIQIKLKLTVENMSERKRSYLSGAFKRKLKQKKEIISKNLTKPLQRLSSTTTLEAKTPCLTSQMRRLFSLVG